MENRLSSFAKAAKMGAKYFLTEVYENSIHFVLISHTMPDLKSMHGGRKSSGGEWLEYMPTMRLELVRVKGIKLTESGRPQGQVVKIKVKKNDFGMPEVEIEASLFFGIGFIMTSDDFEVAMDNGLLEKKGHGYASKQFNVSWTSQKGLVKLYKEQNDGLFKLRTAIIDITHKEITNKRKGSRRSLLGGNETSIKRGMQKAPKKALKKKT